MHTHSVEEQSDVVAPWEVSLRQVSPGSFQGTMQFARIGEFLIYRDNWSQRTAATGALPADYLAVAGPARPNSGIDWCDAELNTQRLALALPDAELDFIIPSQTPHLVLLMPVHYLKAWLGEEAASSLLLSKRHYFQCDPQLGGRFLNRLQWMLDKYVSQPAERCVTKVATSWGFSELGRFAGDYRHLFGELPSATLKKHRASKLVRLSDILH